MSRRGLYAVAIGSAAALLACTPARQVGERAPGTGVLAVTVRARAREGVRRPSDYDASPGAPARLDYDRLDGVVTWVEPAAGAPSAPRDRHVLRLGPAGFEASVAAVASGARLVVENASAAPATIYAVRCFDAGTLAPGASVEVTPRGAGAHDVLVDEREEVRATVFVAPTAPCVVTRTRETAELAGLAPGSYTVHAWHRRLPPAETTVRIEPDRRTTVELILTVNGLPR